MLESGFKYFTQSKLYIWKKSTEGRDRAKENADAAEAEKISMLARGRVGLTESKLRDLAWSLDVLDLSKMKELSK
jgi:hypothetical protein